MTIRFANASYLVPKEYQGTSSQEQSRKLCELESQLRKLQCIEWEICDWYNRAAESSQLLSPYKVSNDRWQHCHAQRCCANNKPSNEHCNMEPLHLQVYIQIGFQSNPAAIVTLVAYILILSPHSTLLHVACSTNSITYTASGDISSCGEELGMRLDCWHADQRSSGHERFAKRKLACVDANWW